MAHFPAVLIGGPPDSGKSVLTFSLTYTLRQRGIQHYVLRACPDGEGDWTQTADQELVHTILVPQTWTPNFVDHICRDLANRHLPLIVDVGGRPKPWQEAILGCCTHAILLTPDEASRRQWRELMARHGVMLLADLHSALEGEGHVDQSQPILRGSLTGLKRGSHARGPAFDALVDRLAQVLAFPGDELRRLHLENAPVETVVELDRLKRTLKIGGLPAVWEPDSLPDVLAYLPEGVSLALYGRGPNWLYAALAILAYPAILYQFDVRLGWLKPAALKLGRPPLDAALRVAVLPAETHTRLECSLPGGYIDYHQADGLCVPDVPLDRGIICSGKLPHWLSTSLALVYRQARWLAVFQPPLGGAVVVHTTPGAPPVGSVLRV
ncbi:MAG: CRISPR-associated protein Csx3 [Chloroflexota bacterium]